MVTVSLQILLSRLRLEFITTACTQRDINVRSTVSVTSRDKSNSFIHVNLPRAVEFRLHMDIYLNFHVQSYLNRLLFLQIDGILLVLW